MPDDDLGCLPRPCNNSKHWWSNGDADRAPGGQCRRVDGHLRLGRGRSTCRPAVTQRRQLQDLSVCRLGRPRVRKALMIPGQ